MGDRKISIMSSGAIYKTINKSYGNIITDNIYSYAKEDDYLGSPEEGFAEIEKCEAVLDRLYDAAGVERRYRPFRFPYGDKGGENKAVFQKYLADNGFDKLDDRKIAFPFWKYMGFDKDIDTFWTFDVAEYNIRKGSGFTAEDVIKRIHDEHPGSGAPMLADGSHIILLHAHDETEELVPGYYRQFVDHLLANGVSFTAPAFIEKA